MKSILSKITENIGDSIANKAVPEYNELINEASNADINKALKTLTVAELMDILKDNSKAMYDLVREAIGKSLDSKAVADDVKKTAEKVEKKPRVTRSSSSSYSSGCGSSSRSYSSGCGSSSRSYSSGCGSSSRSYSSGC